MLLIVALIIISLFIYFLGDSLKKHPNAYYIGAAAISIGIFLLGFIDMPLFVKKNILGIFAKGSLGTAMFVFVMYAGALPKGNRFIAPLMKIRGELSITAAILVLCHNFTYGRTYFRMLFVQPEILSETQLAAAIISIIMIIIMIVLTITSFPSVRRRMQAKKWKQLQRTAYLFYGLMYVHIMLINVPYARLGMSMYIVNVIVYSIVFLGYAAMRISKALITNAQKNKKNISAALKFIPYIISALLCVAMITVCFAGKKNTTDSAYSDEEDEMDKFFSQETVTQMSKEAESKLQNENATLSDQQGENASSEVKEAQGDKNVQENVENTGSNTGSSSNENSGGSNSSSGNTSGESNGGSGNGSNVSDTPQEVQPANTTFKADGTYTGTATCELYNYAVTVTIVVSGDKITSVTATSEASGQDREYFNMANASVPGQLLANQSTTGVDSVAGATKSSTAIKKAFYNAYKSARK
ncbi:MAG: ferric reductase-like transmembrane domain-containing protein [Lachnospira sp.]|nr:ferric reductase-like transmembrane domain-containing protein [Lachnospira sp.]